MFKSREYVFTIKTYFKELLIELRLNSYKVRIIFVVYFRIRVKWTFWAGTSPIVLNLV